MRLIESASVPAAESTVMLSGAPGLSGIVSVTTIRSIPDSSYGRRSKAFPEKTPWVAQAITLRAPSSSTVLAAAQSVPAVSIMSSEMIATLSRTSPTT